MTLYTSTYQYMRIHCKGSKFEFITEVNEVNASITSIQEMNANVTRQVDMK